MLIIGCIFVETKIYNMIILIGLLILNIFLGCVNHSEENYKTSAFNFFAAGAVFLIILKATI